jgi:hypothetical protein
LVEVLLTVHFLRCFGSEQGARHAAITAKVQFEGIRSLISFLGLLPLPASRGRSLAQRVQRFSNKSSAPYPHNPRSALAGAGTYEQSATTHLLVDGLEASLSMVEWTAERFSELNEVCRGSKAGSTVSRWCGHVQEE